MAKDIKFKLIVDGKEAEYSVEKLGKLLESLGYKGFRSFSKFGSETKKVEKYLEGVRRTLGRLQRTLVAIAGVWVAREVIRGFEGLAKSGIEFNKTMEQARIGIGAVLAAQTKMKDALGHELKGREKILAAQAVAAKVSRDLFEANKRTAATYRELLIMFQQALPHALAEGFKIEQIEEFTVAMSQAATAMGIPLNMMAEEMRAMLKGTITAKNTLIATALGMDKTVIKSLQGHSEELYNYIMKYLKAFQLSAIDIQRSWSGLLSNVKDIFSSTMGVAFKDFFENTKHLFSGLIQAIGTPEFEAFMTAIADAMVWFENVALDAAEAISKGFAEVYDMLKAVWDLLNKASNLAVSGVDKMYNWIYEKFPRFKPFETSTRGGASGGWGEAAKRDAAEATTAVEMFFAKLRTGMGTSKTRGDELNKILDNLKGLIIESTAKLGDSAERQKELEKAAKETEKAWAKNRNYIVQVAREMYDQRETTLKLRLEIAKLTKDKEAQLEIEKQLLESQLIAKVALGEYTEEQAKLAEQLNKLKLNKLAEELDKTGKMMKEMAKDIAQNMERAFEDFFFNAMNLKFGDMVDNFTDAIQKMFARLLASGLMKVIAGESWEEGIFGGMFGKIFSGGGGGGGESFTPTAGTGEWTYHFASGGVINEPVVGVGQRSGRGYIMGEAGPEAVVPLGGTAEPGNVIVNIENKGTEKNAEAQVRLDVRGMVIDIMMEDLISHGPYSQALKGGGV